MATNLKVNVFSENISSDNDLNERRAISFAKKAFKFFAEKVGSDSALQGRKFNTVSFDILYCNSEKTHKINREYRKKDSPADIITFAVFADAPENEKFIFDCEINLGEIVIALDKVTQNAREKNVSETRELYFLIAHGILHLLGFDHQCEADYNFVVNLQEQALELCKIS